MLEYEKRWVRWRLGEGMLEELWPPANESTQLKRSHAIVSVQSAAVFPEAQLRARPGGWRTGIPYSSTRKFFVTLPWLVHLLPTVPVCIVPLLSFAMPLTGIVLESPKA